MKTLLYKWSTIKTHFFGKISVKTEKIRFFFLNEQEIKLKYLTRIQYHLRNNKIIWEHEVLARTPVRPYTLGPFSGRFGPHSFEGSKRFEV